MKFEASLPKCHIGSATLKNMRPIPMPALNSIAIQAKSLNSFSASTPPILMLPYLPNAKYSSVTMKMLTASR